MADVAVEMEEESEVQFGLRDVESQPLVKRESALEIKQELSPEIKKEPSPDIKQEEESERHWPSELTEPPWDEANEHLWRMMMLNWED